MSGEQSESFNLPNTFAPVTKYLYRCEKGHEEMQEPDADHVCSACNYAFKMAPVEKFIPPTPKKKRDNSPKLHPIKLEKSIEKAIVESPKVVTAMVVEDLSKKTYTVGYYENGVKVRSLFEDPDYKLELWLPEEDAWRWLGNWDPSEGLFFMKRRSRHLHRQLNAWGVSDYVIKFLEPRGLKTLVMFVEDTREVFESTLENLRAHGEWRWWKQGGYDRQCFLPIPHWVQKKGKHGN